MITIKDTQIFPGHHVPSQNDVWKRSNCKVPTATPLIWSLHKENLNNVLFSFPWSALSCLCWLPSAAIWAAGWLRPRPISAACGLGRLPAVPADMCSSKRWMNNGAVQPGGVFCHPFPDQCVHGAAPVAYSTGKLSQELPHNSQKHGCSNKILTLEMRWNEQLGCGESAKRNSGQLLRYNLSYWCQTVIITL